MGFFFLRVGGEELLCVLLQFSWSQQSVGFGIWWRIELFGDLVGNRNRVTAGSAGVVPA